MSRVAGFWRWLVLFWVVAFLAACTPGIYQSSSSVGGARVEDGPPLYPHAHLLSLTDVAPKAESLCRGCARPYEIEGVVYTPMQSSVGFRQQGVASWYGRAFHGKPTATGEPYDMFAMTAAHKTLPLPSYVAVRNLDNGREAVVRVNDRGPFRRGRVLDLSYAAAQKLDIVNQGSARVELVAMQPSGEKGFEELAFLQAGSFSDPRNAAGLAQRLEAAGLSPVDIVEVAVNDRLMHRVRVGPVDETQSTLLLARLINLGLKEVKLVIE